MADTIREPARDIPVAANADICVLGGSCTGVFAAVRAARLGARVVLVEAHNCFGGMAAAGMLNTWTGLRDTEKKTQIAAGLTSELLIRLDHRSALITDHSRAAEYTFNSEELKIELDGMVTESGVRAYLHTHYCAPLVEGNRVTAAIFENKSGRFAVRAAYFIDATGDGDLCAQLGLTYKRTDVLQPPTSCVKFWGIDAIGYEKFRELIRDHGAEFGLHRDGGWGGAQVCVPGLTFHAETHVYHTDCSDGDKLTAAEIEGRRQIRAMMDVIRKYAGEDSIRLAALCAHIGIRETRHARCLYSLTEEDVLSGRRFPDAVVNGSRQVDVHHSDKPGLTFRFLDGREVYSCQHERREGRWRPETETNPTFWQVPYRCLIPRGIGNVAVCGRAVDADPGAFGAVRLMVSTNQMGEAAGVAAALALRSGADLEGLTADALRTELARGGSIML